MEILGYDKNSNPIKEYILMKESMSWIHEDNIVRENKDPRLYCVIKASDGKVYALSIFDVIFKEEIKKNVKLSKEQNFNTLVKTIEEMKNYEIAYNKKGEPIYCEGKEFIKEELEELLKDQENKKLILH